MNIHTLQKCNTTPIADLIILKYNELFSLFKGVLWKQGHIVALNRGLILKDHTPFFWDYFSHTHWMMENEKDISRGIRCIQAIFEDWEQITFSHHSSAESNNEDLLCLDSFFKKLSEDDRKKADALLLELIRLEYQHFNPKVTTKTETRSRIAEVFHKTRWKGD